MSRIAEGDCDFHKSISRAIIHGGADKLWHGRVSTMGRMKRFRHTDREPRCVVISRLAECGADVQFPELPAAGGSGVETVLVLRSGTMPWRGLRATRIPSPFPPPSGPSSIALSEASRRKQTSSCFVRAFKCMMEWHYKIFPMKNDLCPPLRHGMGSHCLFGRNGSCDEAQK